jgi:hypothetical protein
VDHALVLAAGHLHAVRSESVGIEAPVVAKGVEFGGDDECGRQVREVSACSGEARQSGSSVAPSR